MDFTAIIGFLSSLVTIEEGGRSWFPIIRKYFAKKKINLKNWDSEDPLVQHVLDAFKSDVKAEYKEHIFSNAEIDQIGDEFLKQDRFSRVSYEDGKRVKDYITDIFHKYNDYNKSQMSLDGKIIYDKIDQDSKEIKERIENSVHNANFEKFTHAVDECKNIDLPNIESLINDEYEIDRSDEIEVIKRVSGRFISIHGHAGYGKSALAKKLVENQRYVLYTRADRLSRFNEIDEIWGFSLHDVIPDPVISTLYIYVDALEYIADCGDSNGMHVLGRLYYFVEQNEKTIIVTTCRTEDQKAFIKLFSQYNVRVFVLNGLTEFVISDIKQKYPVLEKISQKSGYRRLLESPFYLNLIVSRISNLQGEVTEYEIREQIWRDVICMKNSSVRYGVTSKDIKECVLNITLKSAKEYVSSIPSDDVDEKILRALVSENVVEEKEGNVRLRFDIYEDICFEHIIDGYYNECKGDRRVFFDRIRDLGRCVYRRYQIWISNKLLIEDSKDKILHNLAFDDEIAEEWRNQTYIGITKSDYSSSFFENYYDDLVIRKKLAEFIRIINLYSFDIGIDYSEYNDVKITPIGEARRTLIKLLANSESGTSELSPESIIKICNDYSLQGDDDIEAKKAAVILIDQYIDKVINPIYLYHIKFRLAEVNEDWIRSFLLDLSEDIHSKDRSKRRNAEKAIDDILRRPEDNLILFFSKEICNLADSFWRIPKIEDDDRCPLIMGYYSRIEGVGNYGLSGYADYHSHNTRWMDYSFLIKVLLKDFEAGFTWCINFINYAIEKYSNYRDNDLFEVRVYFSNEGVERVYKGSLRLWLASVEEQTIPTIIGDILYTLKFFLLLDFSREINKGNLKYERINYVRERIYKESNNICLLQIIEEMGIHFSVELPGYAIDLCSSLDLLYLDVRRHVLFQDNAIRDMLESQILQAVNMPFLNRKRYNLDNKCNMGLQEYAIRTQIYVNDFTQLCNDICDYLYERVSEESYSDEYRKQCILQIEKMDLRKYHVIDRGDGTVALYGKDDESSTIDTNKENSKIDNAKKEDTEEGTSAGIKENIEKLNNEYTNAIKIPEMLKRKDISVEKREELSRTWIEGLNRFFLNGSFLSDNKDVDVLFQQLKEDISNDTKERLAVFILKCLGYNENNGVILDIAYSAEKFLEKNQKLAHKFFYAQLSMAEDSGIDVETAVQRYIIGNDEVSVTADGIDDFDIYRLCDVAICGLTIEDEQYALIMEYLISSYEKLTDRTDHKNYDYSLKTKVEMGLRRELINSNKAVDVLVDTFVNYTSTKMNDDIVNLYKDVFFHISAAYFDGQNDKSIRKKIEDRLEYIAQKAENVNNQVVLGVLYQTLILTMSRYSGDWSTLRAEYSYTDKMFLKKQLSVYGKYNPGSMLLTIYNYHIEKLLPEILPAISTTLKGMSKENEKYVFSDSNSLFILDRIICYAFLNCCEEIKEQGEYVESFEGILDQMINWENPKAAVILDEFRLH